MAVFINQGAAKNLADLINAIGELIAPILDWNDSVAAWKIGAVNIVNPAHLLSWPFKVARPKRSPSAQRARQPLCRARVYSRENR
jgi:hypothetical protein